MPYASTPVMAASMGPLAAPCGARPTHCTNSAAAPAAMQAQRQERSQRRGLCDVTAVGHEAVDQKIAVLAAVAERRSIQQHDVAACGFQNCVTCSGIPFAHIAEARIKLRRAFRDAAEFERRRGR